MSDKTKTMGKSERKIVAYRSYFLDFFSTQTVELKEKVAYVLGIVRDLEIIPSKYFRHIEGTHGIYEIRIEFESNIYRIFCFFDEGNLVILENGFQKTTQKTPKKEIKKAIKIRKEYLNEKE